MNELVFNVEFLSDIVLPATSNTEGNIEQLDFIPGSNFLGMAARKYTTFSDAFAVFHSGKVRFGDATLLAEGECTYKMPLSFFHEKLDDGILVNHHHILNFSKYKQLKQKRKGHITSTLKEVAVKYNYAQKSAYDKENRRSKESAMYGYQSIPAGAHWQFIVKYSDAVAQEDIENIKSTLLGKQRLGKSKSAQYGRVIVSDASKALEVRCAETKGRETILYVKSRLALVDEEGNPSYDLRYLLEDLNDENIIWDKTQIKTTTFTPYNSAMQTKSYERMVINSGSVIVLQNLSEVQIDRLKEGIGAYLSEGFGEVLVNPDFLMNAEKFSLSKIGKVLNEKKSDIEDPVSQFLLRKREQVKSTLKLAEDVSAFKKKYQALYANIRNAQWGTIRSICNSPMDDFRQEIRDYVSSGKVTWKIEQIETLLEEEKSRAFIKLLAMQMPKEER